MGHRLCGVFVVGVGLSCMLARVVAADPAETAKIDSRILAIADVVLQNHIDPPTRQQMILTGIKALYRADNRPTPKGLSEDVSALASADQIADYMQSIRAEFNELKDAERILTNGMLEAVPGQAYLIDANDNKVQGQLAANRYVGTGIALGMSEQEKLPTITRVFYNGPAWKAGVQVDDIIVEIDSETTASLKLQNVVEMLRGEENSEVEVVVRQPDSKELRRLTIERGRVFIPTVEGHRQISAGEWDYTIESAEDIALLRIKNIGPSTLHELRQVETKLRGQNIRGIILDLRFGGGLLHDLVMVADSLLDGGVIGHVRSLDAVKTYEARPGALFQNIPMAVLIAEHAATDRVFLTAALQDRNRAIIIGERTSGKTYVNQFVPIPDRDEKIRLAVAVAQRGDGTPLLGNRPHWSPATHFQVTEATERKRSLPRFIVPDHLVHARLHGNSDKAPDPPPLADNPMLAKAIEVLRHTASRAPSSAPQEDIAR